MELFKMVGTIVANNKEANNAIDETTEKAEKSKSKISSAFAKIGKSVSDGLKSEHPKKFSQSLDKLTSTVNEQEDKLAALKDKYKDLYLTQGKNSKEARECAKEIKSLSEELRDNEKKLSKADKAVDKFDKSLDDASTTAEKAKEKIGKAFNNIGKAGVVVGKAVATGLAVGIGAAVKLGKVAVESYADYEQLVGGVETLFGAQGMSIEEYAKSVGKTVSDVKGKYNDLQKSQNLVMKNASNAYITAGMSANEYMETITGFSASLLQSLDGDTVKAAEKANVAITDMSDNTNKMGTDISSIQNAYQGFAKQNYTMLDNLKLGYGGTKEEMQRLLEDAEKLSGQKFDLSSYADIVDAIHIVQTEMGITGTTANEASTTIQGSISSAKGAWQNLMVGLADDTQDFDVLISNFADSVIVVLDNLLPRISIIAKKIPELISKIVAKLPNILNDILPSLVTAATSLVAGLVDALPSIISALIAVLPLLLNGISTIVDALVEAVPQIIDAIVGVLIDPNSVQSILEGAIKLLLAIPMAISKALPSFIAAAPDIINGLIQGLIQAVPLLLSSFGEILNSLLQAFLTFFGIHSPSRVMMEKAKFIVEGIINGIKELPQKAAEIFLKMKDRVTEKVDNIKSIVTDKFNSIKEKILTPIEKARDKIKDIVDKIKGFFSGMKLSFPNIKMPHFKISPSGWKIGDLLQGSIPKLGIDWYDKAMDDGMILNKPTIFGINSNGQPMGGGESGSETVVGTNNLMSMIQTAVNNANAGSSKLLELILAELRMINSSFVDKLITELQKIGIKWDEREIARLIRKYA